MVFDIEKRMAELDGKKYTDLSACMDCLNEASFLLELLVNGCDLIKATEAMLHGSDAFSPELCQRIRTLAQSGDFEKTIEFYVEYEGYKRSADEEKAWQAERDFALAMGEYSVAN